MVSGIQIKQVEAGAENYKKGRQRASIMNNYHQQ